MKTKTHRAVPRGVRVRAAGVGGRLGRKGAGAAVTRGKVERSPSSGGGRGPRVRAGRAVGPPAKHAEEPISDLCCVV